MKNKIIVIVLGLVILLLIVFLIFNNTKKSDYYIKAISIDRNSPDVKLAVYENDSQIDIKAIYYVNNVLLCNGNNLTTNKFNIKNNDQMKVILKDNKEVIAKIVMEE